MNITLHRLREIVIDDKLDTLEIYTTRHQFRANEYPDIALLECADHALSLCPRTFAVDYVDV